MLLCGCTSILHKVNAIAKLPAFTEEDPTCPVCLMKVSDRSIKSSYKGKSYYFCLTRNTDFTGKTLLEAAFGIPTRRILCVTSSAGRRPDSDLSHEGAAKSINFVSSQYIRLFRLRGRDHHLPTRVSWQDALSESGVSDELLA